MPGPRQPGQAEEQLGDEEPGPVAPSDAALQRLYIALKSIFISETCVDLSIFGLIFLKKKSRFKAAQQVFWKHPLL